MKIAVFGATGRVGSLVVKHAIKRGFAVKALVRDRSKAEAMIPDAELIVGDTKEEAAVRQTLDGCDLVFSGLSTDKTDTLTTSFPHIIRVMKEKGISRIVTIGTAGILNSRHEEGKFRFETNESKRKQTFAAEEHAQVYRLLQASDLEWTIICPTYLPDGGKEGIVRYEINKLPEDGKKITVADTAEFAMQEMIDSRFPQKRVGICY
ncbi:NAD(P)H-binding protein [Halobacillus sp. ACCC02827]|uniref:NAD(P)-dependent oxidoreductase n=1 Tax=Halobacillus sp. ACCC02827 TaxID=3052090 RepID=UPI00256FB214|nr:NAD(P)H-binding protein [Halobacillus sp. ACCC02827]WJE16758.1 NAD(P)H-binding protein [Halobacillus sp. ACCC02827]